MGNGEVLNCYAFNLYKTSEQDACPGGHAPLAERDDSLRQHYNIFAVSHYTIYLHISLLLTPNS